MITQRNLLLQQIQAVRPTNFDALALQLFQYQSVYNSLYRQYLSLIQVNPVSVQSVVQIPFLPIAFFKTHEVVVGVGHGLEDVRERAWDVPSVVFSSSGTTGDTTSRHFVRDVNFYKKNTLLGFEKFYGKVEDYCVLGLLPSYLERTGSSLIAMVDYFIKQSNYPKSGFFLYNHAELAIVLQQCQQAKIPTLLIGVSFALLDFAEKYPMDLSNTIIMETGGMKGRRKEITRTALHTILQHAFNVPRVHSEYGMTELLSQGYSQGKGIFYPAPTLKVIPREITDPFSSQKFGKTGGLNIIDLANIDSCAFIATDDLGRVYEDGSFEVLGRLDSSDVRGCNLMVV